MFPIILVHGIARFDILLELQKEKLGLEDDLLDDLHYFKGIATHLKNNGFENVFHSNQNFAGSVEQRSRDLARRIDSVLASTEARKVHLIAHSMGGLDARHAVVDLDYTARVASLTTIGTPHLGTPLADRVLSTGGLFWIKILESVVDLTGFADLTTTACGEFNTRAESSEATNDVLYQTYSSSEDLQHMFLPLVASSMFLSSKAGPNDGLVPVSSQSWTSELRSADGKRKQIEQKSFPFPADHLNQLGWWDLQESVNPLVAGDILTQKRTFEANVKDIYLQIARDVSSIE